MNQDIIAMAREAGAWAQQSKNCDVEYVMSGQSLERFAALVAAAERDKWMERTAILIRGEREACAKVCDEHERVALSLWHRDIEANKPFWNGEQQAAYRCAEAIRARGETK